MITGNVDEVMAKLAVIEREILDPVSNKAVVAFENVPYTISAADMPLFVNFVGALTDSEMIGSDDRARTYNDTRNYTLTLYHSPYGAGVEGEKRGLLTPYFALVYDVFAKYPHLKMMGGVLDAKLVGDSGMTIVNFVSQQYYGVRFTLQVTSKTRRLIGDYE
jgi:hypothetical protein